MNISIIKRMRGFFVALLAFSFLLTGCAESPANTESTAVSSSIETTQQSTTETTVSVAKETTAELQTTTPATTTTKATTKAPTPKKAQTAKKQKLTFTVLNVGQGLSVLIETDGHRLLYDGGDREASSYVVSYLNKHGATSFDYLIASHYDADHINGLVGVLKNYSVRHFLGPDYETDTRTYRSMISTLAQNGIPIRNPEPGDTIKLGDAKITIVAPNSSYYDDSNDYSIAIKVTFGSNTFYISGDAETESINEILSYERDIRADVYVAGHHGSRTSITASYLQKIAPKYAIISCGEGNSYGHPHKETLSLLKNQGCKLFRTDLQKEIVITCDGKNYFFNVKPTTNFTPGSGSVKENKTQAATTKKASTDNSVTYIGNKNSQKFHLPSCNSLPLEKNRIYFNSRNEAVQSGYEPCKRCNP